MMQGQLFEEFERGEIVETSGRTITEADVVMFAGLTGDHSELH
jgi:3-hydroxybutyryl-CoA dehydratase